MERTNKVRTKDVPAYMLVAGVPAKSIGKVDEYGNILVNDKE